MIWSSGLNVRWCIGMGTRHLDESSGSRVANLANASMMSCAVAPS